MSTQKARVLRVTVHANVLRVAIGFSGMSQRELAKEAGVSQSMVARLASGDRTTCKYETAQKIVDAFDLKALKIKSTDMFEVQVFRAPVALAA